jgi:phosphatidylglycerol---prolipoprotein diacylglyceryl transferase
MYPTLLSIGPLDFHAYTIFLCLGFLIGVLGPIRDNYRLEKPYDVTPAIGIWVLIGALMGARLYHIVQYESPLHFYRAIFFWHNGLVFYGGLFGGAAVCVAYLRIKKIPVLFAGDIVMPWVALAQSVA